MTSTLDVRAGEALGIIGPNGAGKTTLFNLITGGVEAGSREHRLDGVDITLATPHRALPCGHLGARYQIPQPFEKLTVFENLLVGAVHGQGKREREVDRWLRRHPRTQRPDARAPTRWPAR